MADHTGKRAKRERKRIDTSSIKTTTLLSFVVFALFLVMVLWGLSNFYLNSFYERARSQEVIRTAETLEAQFKQDRYNFASLAVQTAGTNDIYIRIDTAEESLVFDGTREVQGSDAFEDDVARIKAKLDSSPGNSVSETRRDTSGMGSRLVYASYIKADGVDNVLCIIAPLYPDQVTVRILRDMLIYVSFIVLIVSLLLAFALSVRLTSPIEKLTRSATELSKGNHDVYFDGAGFTETKELARALNKASYEMEKTDFYQREIIANVSHDLKTPLTMIRSYAEKIMDITGDNPEKRNADLNVIISETEHLNKLVTDMLSVSNLQSNNVEMHMETFDLVKAATSVYESFQVLESDGFEMHFHPCKAAYVVGDRTRLTQVMTNLVSNAVKYSGDNKYIEIRLNRSNRKVTFHCIDHGVGIPSDEIGHVWDKYYRTSANHERGIEGTGLGLAIVKSLLNLHGAKYGVESEEGKGSDFWFEMDTVKSLQRKRQRRKMAKKAKTVFICTECGNEYTAWQGQCSYCGAWNTIVEHKVAPIEEAAADTRRRIGVIGRPVKLGEVGTHDYTRMDSGLSELNRVLGGGIVPGSLTLISGEPGIGKSTLIAQAAGRIADKYGPVLYVSGEESEEQVKLRADRVLGKISESLYIYPETNIENIMAACDSIKPCFIIIDSIQTMYSQSADSVAGSLTQIRECSGQLIRYAKNRNVPVFIVAHVTKSGELAGPKTIEHMVDTVLSFSGERDRDLRILRSFKNRFGTTDEIGAFRMTEDGMIEVPDLSGSLIESTESEEGSVVSAVYEGTRPVFFEIQALVTRASVGFARRTAIGISQNRLNMILAVLEKKAGLDLVDYDVYVNVVGGMNTGSTSTDLAVALAIYSSFKGRSASRRVVAVGEVGLTGNLRSVPNAEKIVQEAVRLGYEEVILPERNARQTAQSGKSIDIADKGRSVSVTPPAPDVSESIRICGASNIVDAIRAFVS